MNKSSFGDKVSAELTRQAGVKPKFLVSSTWDWEHWRGGECIDSWSEKNICTDQGLEYVLDVAFSSATQVTDWYIAIFNDNHSPAAGDDCSHIQYYKAFYLCKAQRDRSHEARRGFELVRKDALSFRRFLRGFFWKYNIGGVIVFFRKVPP